jgi:predicted HicB family RNase H-like nuclease
VNFALDAYISHVYIGSMSFEHTLIVKITRELNEAIKAAADRMMMSKSAWVRNAIMEKLERNGK